MKKIDDMTNSIQIPIRKSNEIFQNVKKLPTRRKYFDFRLQRYALHNHEVRLDYALSMYAQYELISTDKVNYSEIL